MISMQQNLIPIGGALVCAGVGSVTDLRDRRIPNWLTCPATLAGLLLHGITQHWSGLGDSALAGLIAGGIALLFWLARGMGAGDVKLMTAVGCIAGLSSLPLLLLSISIAGAVFGLAFSAFRGRPLDTLSNTLALIAHHGRRGLTPHPTFNLGNLDSLRLPFALPVAAGCLFTLCFVAMEAPL